MRPDESTRRHALDAALRATGTTNGAIAVRTASMFARFLTGEPLANEEYRVGPATMDRVFKRAGLTNLSDLQAVLDAVEKALAPFDWKDAADARGGPWGSLDDQVHDYVQDYELRDPDYTPNDHERFLITDAIHGFIADHAQPRRVGPYQVSAGELTTAVVLADVSRERDRQRGKGWTAESDDARTRSELAGAAGWAILPHELRRDIPNLGWIEGDDRRDELVKGIATAVAEVERLDRAAPAVPSYQAVDPLVDARKPLAPAAEHATSRVLTTADVPAIVREATLAVQAASARSTPHARR